MISVAALSIERGVPIPLILKGPCRLADDKYFESLKRRFWKYVDKSPGQGPKGDCWEWRGATLPPKGLATIGYGVTADRRKRKGKLPASSYTHRISFEIHHGYDPIGFQVAHSCDNPPCVNPAHLWKATPLMNTHDALLKGRPRGAKRKRKLNPLPPVRAKRISLTSQQGGLLIRARKEKGLSQSDVARMIGLDTTHYCRFERARGDRSIRYEHFLAVLAVLGVGIEGLAISQDQIHERGKPDLTLPKRSPYVRMRKGKSVGADRGTKLRELPTPNLEHYRSDIIRHRFRVLRKTIMQVENEARVTRWTVKGALAGDPIKRPSLERICTALGLEPQHIGLEQTARNY